tara:strand:- start:1128 stop:2588 length:1461 start_codon:yes stop_codon:yes gene_type:complete
MNNFELKKFNEAIFKIKESKIKESEKILSDINNPLAYYNAALVSEKIKNFDLAIKFYDKSIKLDPNYYQAFINKSIVIEKKGDIISAIKCLESTNKIKSNLHYITYHNLGNLYSKILKYSLSIKYYKKSYELNKDNLLSLHNIANIYEEIGNFKKSLQVYDKLIQEAKKKKIVNKFPKTLLNRALLLVKLGKYKKGLKDYEYRWFTPEFIKRKKNFGVETWKKNQNISGKTLLVFNEQGLGDTIYFYGCLKELIKKNIKIIFLIQKPLEDLFKKLDKEILVISNEKKLPKFDYSISLLSLPFYLDWDKKKISNYRININPEKKLKTYWNSILLKKNNIGISWKGSQYKNAKFRTIGFEKLSVLFKKHENLNFYCLHNEYTDDEKFELRKYKNVNYYLGNKMNFSNTLALCSNLDLVITIDTSIAHISCVAGTKTWILSKINPSWLFHINSNKSLMYPSAKLFKQLEFNNWDNVIDNVSLKLRKLFK